MGIVNELSTIKTRVSDKVVSNKVSRFAYTERAYTDNDADGVNAYDVNAQQNIPVGTASVMKVNQTVIEKGWRARASSITRMLMNHFLGRMSYNLNKANDLINSILNLLVTYIGSPDGIASLDSSGRVPVTQINKSNVGIPDGMNSFTTKGAYDYSLNSATPEAWLGKVFGRLLGRRWALMRVNSGSQLSGVFTPVYANGLWVAGSPSGAWWSEDFVNWTQGTGGTSVNFREIAYNNGLWVASTLGNGMWWSTDGKNWTQGTGGTSISFYSPSYADGIWVVGSSENGLWWSNDGKSWTQGTGGNTAHTVSEKPLYANNLWLANSQTQGFWWSNDGKSWTQGTGDNSTYATHTPAYANGVWIGGTRNGLCKSTDGKVWSAIADTNGYYMKSPCYANGLWVAGGDTKDAGSPSAPVACGMWYSEDTENWTHILESHFCDTPVYANGLWIAGSNQVRTTPARSVSWISEDGKNWSDKVTVNSTRKVAYHNGRWVAGGSNSGFYYSDAQMLMEDGTLTD